jgi:hypothetical protein
MKKITTLLICLVFLSAFSQSKSTGTISLGSSMTANFTLNSATSEVTLILTGPSDRWFGLGLGIQSNFGMGAGDVLVYTTSLTDRNFIGTQTPANDTQDWTTLNDTFASGVRTLTLKRNLTNSDTKDFQLPYGSTNSINVAWAHNNANNNSISSNHNVGFASGTFTTVLAVEDFSLNATAIYPNPASGAFTIKTKTNLSKIKLYNQTGSLIKTIDVMDDAREVTVDVNGIQSGVYLLELQNDSEKSWKKVILN